MDSRGVGGLQIEPRKEHRKTVTASLRYPWAHAGTNVSGPGISSLVLLRLSFLQSEAVSWINTNGPVRISTVRSRGRSRRAYRSPWSNFPDQYRTHARWPPFRQGKYTGTLEDMFSFFRRQSRCGDTETKDSSPNSLKTRVISFRALTVTNGLGMQSAFPGSSALTPTAFSGGQASALRTLFVRADNRCGQQLQ